MIKGKIWIQQFSETSQNLVALEKRACAPHLSRSKARPQSFPRARPLLLAPFCRVFAALSCSTCHQSGFPSSSIRCQKTEDGGSQGCRFHQRRAAHGGGQTRRPLASSVQMRPPLSVDAQMRPSLSMDAQMRQSPNGDAQMRPPRPAASFMRPPSTVAQMRLAQSAGGRILQASRCGHP